MNKQVRVTKYGRQICTWCGYPLIDGWLQPVNRTIRTEQFCKPLCVQKYYADKGQPPNSVSVEIAEQEI